MNRGGIHVGLPHPVYEAKAGEPHDHQGEQQQLHGVEEDFQKERALAFIPGQGTAQGCFAGSRQASLGEIVFDYVFILRFFHDFLLFDYSTSHRFCKGERDLFKNLLQ